MSVYRNVQFEPSEIRYRLYAIRSHRGDFDPDKHVDLLDTRQCQICIDRNMRIQKVIDTLTGNTYIAWEENRT